MKFTTSLKSLIWAIALTAVAGVASAATVFAQADTSGTFVFNGGQSTSMFTGTVSGSLIGDTAPARSYTLNYSFTANVNGTTPTGTISGQFALPSFSIDSLIASLPPIPGSFGPFTIPSTDITLTYSNGSVSGNTASADFVLSLGNDSTIALRDALGLPAFNDRATGTFVGNATLTADVSTVPLPAAAPLLLFGIGGLVAVRRKRRKAA